MTLHWTRMRVITLPRGNRTIPRGHDMIVPKNVHVMKKQVN